jgi:hypothetical protein
MNGSHVAYALPYRALALSGAATEDRLFRFTGSLAARAAETTSGPVHDGNRPKDCKTYSREVIRRPVWRPDARLIPRCPCSETLRPTHAVHRGEPIQRVPVACREFSRSPFSPLHASPSTPTAQRPFKLPEAQDRAPGASRGILQGGGRPLVGELPAFSPGDPSRSGGSEARRLRFPPARTCRRTGHRARPKGAPSRGCRPLEGARHEPDGIARRTPRG